MIVKGNTVVIYHFNSTAFSSLYRYVSLEHTDVNDPLLGGWLPCMPVIPEAELHFWVLVIFEHSHHNSLGQKSQSKNLVFSPH